MAGTGSSMLYSFLLFTVILSLQEMYRGKLASSELFTILGGFISSLLFLTLLTFIGNFQESNGMRSGWGSVDALCSYIGGTCCPDCCRNSTPCLCYNMFSVFRWTTLRG